MHKTYCIMTQLPGQGGISEYFPKDERDEKNFIKCWDRENAAGRGWIRKLGKEAYEHEQRKAEADRCYREAHPEEFS